MSLIPHGYDAETNLFALIYCLVMFMMVWLGHELSKIKQLLWFPEASLQMLIGVFCTLPIRGVIGDASKFDSQTFYLLCLPVILFNSGFNLNNYAFFRNFFAIFVYANVGTLVNTLIVGIMMYQFGKADLSVELTHGESYAFGSILSATDPVTTIAVFDRLAVEPNLYMIVVGISTLDDAVAVIMFNLFQSFAQEGSVSNYLIAVYVGQFFLQFFGSILLGYLIGLAGATFFKFIPTIPERLPLFMAQMVFFVYVSYLLADVLHMSGIISCFFASISFRRYFEPCKPTEFVTIKSAMAAWSYAFESFVFFRIGLSLFNSQPGSEQDWQFIGWSLFACLVGRIAQVYPLAILINWFNARSELNLCCTTKNDKLRNNNIANDHNTHMALDATENAHEDGDIELAVPSLDLPVDNDNRQTLRVRGQQGQQVDREQQPSIYHKRHVHLSLGYQHMILFAGLRGPIAYATCRLFDNQYGNRRVVVAATNFTVAVTTFVLGSLTVPALDWFKIPYGPQAMHTFSVDPGANDDNNSDPALISEDNQSCDDQETLIDSAKRLWLRPFSLIEIMHFLERCEYRLVKRHYKRSLEANKDEHKKHPYIQPQVITSTTAGVVSAKEEKC